MKLLVTTSKSVLTVGTENGQTHVVHSGKGLYYGIAYSHNAIFIAARNSNDCFDYLGRQHNENGEILVFDFTMKQVGSLRAPFPLRDMHQILYSDGKLWITCSFDNMVAVFDFRHWQRWYPSEDERERGKDIHHFNSLYRAGRDFYVLGHNFGASDIWRFSYPGLQLKEKIRLGNQAHNIWLDGQELYTCDSQYGLVVGNHASRNTIGGFSRGAVMTADRIYIGTSDVAERESRDQVSSRIVVFDRKWRLVDEWIIDGHGQLLDMRIPGVEDQCVPGMVGQVFQA